MKDRKVKQVLYIGEYQWDGGDHKERVKEGEYSKKYFIFVYENVIMEPVDIVLRSKGRRIKKMKVK
jgi:hypothetical protein